MTVELDHTDLGHHGDAELAPGLLDLAVNVSSLAPPQWLSTAIRSACVRLDTYPDARAATAAVAARHHRAPAEVLLTAGAAEAFTLIAHGLPRGRAVVVHPQFTEPEVALLAAGWAVERIVLDESDGFPLDPARIPDDAAVVVIGNPTNPTGTLHPKAVVHQLRRPGRILVVDEAFMDSVPGETDSLAADPDLGGVLVVRSLTKTWGLAGLRVGYLLGDVAAIEAMSRVQPQWSVSTPALAAAAACSRPDAVEEARHRATAVADERERLRTALHDRGFVVADRSSGPFLLVHHPDRPTLHTDLRDHGIAVRRADTFPGLRAGWVRITVRDPATSRALLAALDTSSPGGSVEPGRTGVGALLGAGPGPNHQRVTTTWPRPVPLIGDRSSAFERASDPAAWALGADTVAALDHVIGTRRDIRRFRPDPVPESLLHEVLSAGHQAPSVGHSQPWRFVVVSDPSTRDRAAHLADRERLRQADQLDTDRRGRLLDLKLEGIREAPVGVVVACDRRSPAAGVLGRATFADTDMWSCACAIENMWLRARAVGLGLGWVTLFEPRDLADLLGLPAGVETLGWLCLGWPDERPPDPGLERAGWSQRLDLASVVISERWPDTPPAAPPSHLRGPDQRAVVAGRDEGDDLLTVPGSLGVLDTAVDRVLALAGGVPTTGTLIIAGGHHPVTRYGVSAYADTVTDDVLDASELGQSIGATTARQSGFAVHVLRTAPLEAQGDLVTADAMTTADVDRLIEYGAAAGRRAAEHGLVCLGEVGVGNTTVAAALVCALLDVDVDVEAAVGLGAGSDTTILARKRDVVARALARARSTYAARLRDPRVALAALGGPEFAVLVGVVTGAAGTGAPVLLDGLATSVAALLAARLEPGIQPHLIAGHRSRERAHHAVLVELGLEPLLELRIRAGEGVGACLAAGLLLTALQVRTTAGRVS